MNILGNAASLEMLLGRLAVFACKVSRQGTFKQRHIPEGVINLIQQTLGDWEVKIWE